MDSQEQIASSPLSRHMRIFLLLATVVVVSISILLTLTKPPEINQESLKQEIQAMQQKLPIQVDANTQLDAVELQNMEILYKFSVVNHSIQETNVNTKDNNFPWQLETAVKTNACANKSTRRYINSGVTLAYEYIDENKNKVASFKIPAMYCKK